MEVTGGTGCTEMREVTVELKLQTLIQGAACDGVDAKGLDDRTGQKQLRRGDVWEMTQGRM